MVAARTINPLPVSPAAPFDACDQVAGQVSSQSLVRYKTNDYSVPVAYGYREVWVRAYVDQVVIGCKAEIIASHPRSYEREDMVFDPIHYLPLIERKINALDQAAPLADWDLPPEFQTLRRLMEARMIKAGRREYVQVLRLLENFELADLHAAVKQALQLGAIGGENTDGATRFGTAGDNGAVGADGQFTRCGWCSDVRRCDLRRQGRQARVIDGDDIEQLAVGLWWCEFNGATIAADGGFELVRCLVVEDMPVDVNDLGVVPALMYGLVGFDEIIGFA